MIKIENDNLLTERFGYWPSFHDAEVVRVRFEREGPDSPLMECEIHVFEPTSEIDASGRYVLRNHTLVTLRFCKIGLEEFKWWNHQNVLSGLYIGPRKESGPHDPEDWTIEVGFGSSYGCDATLVCAAVRVVDAQDFKADQAQFG